MSYRGNRKVPYRWSAVSVVFKSVYRGTRRLENSKDYMGLHVPRLAELSGREIGVSSILIGSTACKTSCGRSMEASETGSPKGLRMSFYGANLHVVYK